MDGPSWFDSDQSINCLLGYRCIYGEITISGRIRSAATTADIRGTKRELIEKGVETLNTTFEKAVDEYGHNVTHVLPLSGGLDSRAILGGLLNHIPAEEIVAVTFGTPGTWDFEVGRQVAHEAGTRHFTVDLRPESFPWSEERLVQNAAEYSHPTKLFRARTSLDFAFKKLREHHGVTNPVYWSGFMGDAVTGDHLPDTESPTWSDARERFVDWTYKCPQLTSPEFDPVSVLPNEPAIDQDVLSYDDQLDFGVRQPYFIEPAATFNDRFVAPFGRNPFLSFMLNVPREYRVGRSLFEEIAAEAYPELFALPTETKAGLPLDAPDPLWKVRLGVNLLETHVRRRIGREQPARSTSHLDWDVELRNSTRLQHLVEEQLSDLTERSRTPWISPIDVYHDHQQGSDRGQEIMLLTSLELFLKAGR